MKTVVFDETKWQLVPKEPTNEMAEAVWKRGYGFFEFKDTYRIGLEKAPQHPEVEHLTEEVIEELADQCMVLDAETNEYFLDHSMFARTIERCVRGDK